MNKAKVKKIWDIVLNVLMYLFLAICLVSVILTVFAKRNDGAAEIFGYQMRTVISDSMEKCEHTDVSKFEIKDIPLRSMVFIKVVPDDPAEAKEFYASLKVGDVLTFRYVYRTQVTITHRITEIEEVEGGFKITLAGDNKNSSDYNDGQLVQVIDTSIPDSPNYIIGKVTGQSYPLGLMTQPLAIWLIVIIPCAVIIILEVIKIIRTLTADKKKKAREKAEEKDRELEELRRKLMELEKEKQGITTQTNEEVNKENGKEG